MPDYSMLSSSRGCSVWKSWIKYIQQDDCGVTHSALVKIDAKYTVVASKKFNVAANDTQVILYKTLHTVHTVQNKLLHADSVSKAIKHTGLVKTRVFN